jgi:hypothetical protein
MPEATVTFRVCVPYSSCHAVTVYDLAGMIAKAQFSSVTAFGP